MKHMPRVLIVEDEPSIAELIAVNLRHNGFQPVWAEDGVSAQRELDAVLPDAILLDWMLPGQSGIVLAKKWRGDARTKAIPILMLTARGDEPDKVAGLVAAGGEHQDGDGLGAGVAAPFFCQHDAALPRQHPVQQDGIGQHCVQLALGRGAVLRPHGLEAVVAQVDGDQLGDRGFVFDDEDSGLVLHVGTAYCTADSISSIEVWRTSAPLTM